MPLFKEKRKENKSSILSATRPKEPILKTSYETKEPLQTRLKQKSIINIYVNDNDNNNNKYYVEHSAAYALGLIKTRAIMLNNPKLVEISSGIYNRLKSDDTIEIKYIIIEKKQPLKVYVDGSNYFIDNSAAYALGFLSAEEFNNSENEYYFITEEVLKDLKAKFDIEYNSLNLAKYTSDKKL